ncbi:hypothetical protein M1N92_05835 [Dehalococcoidia bacterium]|nr:hypothetical protein [Dehalococcoidia bacterium]
MALKLTSEHLPNLVLRVLIILPRTSSACSSMLLPLDIEEPGLMRRLRLLYLKVSLEKLVAIDLKLVP